MKMFFSPFYSKAAVLFALSLCVNSIQAASLREGLVSFWPLETADGGVTPDLASGNTMSIVGAPIVTPGQRGDAFTFDGVSAYLVNVHTPDNSITGLPIYTAGRYSISMWVKGAPQTAKYLFSEGSTTSNNPLLILQTGQAATNNAKFDVIIRNDAGGALVNHVVSTNIVFDDTWHHVAWVDDRGNAKLYIDGNLDPANFSYTPAGVFTFNTTVIGTLVRAAVQNAYFPGQIDDVAIWDRVLTQAEVQEMMTNSVAVSPLFVSRQPVGGTRGLGDRITLAARGGGEQPVTYQWFKGGAEILDATTSSLTLTNITATDAGSYTVQITNPSGTIMSDAAVLTVRPDPAPALRPGLVSYWPMDEMVADAQGNKTEDLYSHNDFRLFTAGFFDQTAGAFGPAILFNGTDQYGLRNGGFPVYNNSAFTVSLWINAGPQADTRFFCESSTNNSNPLFALGTHTSAADPRLRVFIRNDAGVVLLDRFSTKPVLDLAWHHIVFVETNGQARVYIDGQLDDSDFTYTRGVLSLNQSAVGAIVRAAVAAYFLGGIDEVAVWNRALTFTEIQEIRTTGVPAPIMAIPPGITQHPASQSVLTRSRVTLSFIATGTGPLTNQWRRNGAPLSGETNPTLAFNSITLGDSGNYDVIVSNSAGSVTSQVAIVTVTLRPDPPSQLGVDFNNTGQETSAETESGFQSFAIPAIGFGPYTRSYRGVDLTLASVGNINIESRRRAQPVNNGAFTQEQLLRDFVFSRDTTPEQGMDVTAEYFKPNTAYTVTIWSFDNGSVTLDRISDWSANGIPVRTGYTFFGSNLPTTDDQYRFTFATVSDGDGKIVISGRRSPAAGGGLNVFINAVEIRERKLRVLSIGPIEGNYMRLVVELLNPEAIHSVQRKTNLSDAWVDVPEAVVEDPLPGSIEGFLVPITSATAFYRIVELQ
jgi:hypothetical protein